MDQFVGFVASKDDITTNYTGEDVVVTVIDEAARKGSFVNLEVTVAFCLEQRCYRKTTEFRFGPIFDYISVEIRL